MSSRPSPSASLPVTAFIGGGNMARSLIGGLIAHGMPARQIRVSEPVPELREALARDFSVRTCASNSEALAPADVVVLAVKPQIMQAVCGEIAASLREREPLVISIAAGIRVAQIESWLGAGHAIVRSMPNTPALIRAGATGACGNALVTRAQRALAQTILDAVGETIWIADEALMDAVTAVSGSGPAYFFLLAEALEDAGVAHGLPRETARVLATQTCIGAGRMLREDGATAAELRRRVTSPGGTTQAALDSFAASGFVAMVDHAVAAAIARGRELAAQMDD